MRTTLKLAALSAVLVTAAANFCDAQAQSLDVKVAGQIVPAACTLNLGGGGVFNYGNILASTLNRTEYTALPILSLPVSLTCNGPAKVAIRVYDNRADSEIPGLFLPEYGDGYNHGLGTVSGAKIGGYRLSMKTRSTVADNPNAIVITNITPNAPPGTWYITRQEYDYMSHSTKYPYLLSWGEQDGSTISGNLVPVKTVSSELRVDARLNYASELPLSGPIQLDGLATLELVYL